MKFFKRNNKQKPAGSNNRFGGKTMRFSECNERFYGLDGVRIRRIDNGEKGNIYNIFINRQEEIVQIWVNMDARYVCCLRPQNIEFVENKELNEAKLIEA